MAEKVSIDVEINGLEKIDQLDASVSKLGKTAEASSEKVGMSKKAIGMWAAGLYAAKEAIELVVSAGREYIQTMEETNNSIIKTKQLEDDLVTSFGMASASILEHTGLWEGYRTALEGVGNALDAVAGKQAILAQANAEHMKMEQDYQKMLDEDAKKREAEHKKAMARKQREIDADVANQKLLSAFEAKAEESAKAEEARAQKKIDDYERELEANDAWIDSINNAVEAEIELQQAVEGSTSTIEANTEAKTANASSGGSMGAGSSYSTSQSFDDFRHSEHEYLTSQYLKGYNVDEAMKSLDRTLAEANKIARQQNRGN